MDRSAVNLMLDRTLTFLQEHGPILVPRPDRERLLEWAQAVQEKAQRPGETLYVGMLGGTGVGKSTLINALAGEEISGPSDKRPFTDKAVVYRHKSAPRGLQDVAHLLRDQDAVHGSDAVKYLALLDLPDFDSVKEEHRRVVKEILPQLDCVVWVASPEKYADRIFYELVQDAAMGRENFTFVLNKADELLTPGQPDPHSRFKEVLGDFTFRLKHEGEIDNPRLFLISARRELTRAEDDAVLSDEFKRFRGFLMARRDAKEIESMKTLNLGEEARRLVAEIHGLVKPEEKAALVRSLRAMDEERGQGGPALSLVEHELRLQAILSNLLLSSDSSITPVKIMIRLLRLIRTLERKAPEDQLFDAFKRAAEELGKERLLSIQKLSAGMDSELLLALGGAGVKDRLNDPAAMVGAAIQRASSTFAEVVSLHRAAAERSLARARRFFQRLVLLSPAPFFVFKMAGIARIGAFFSDPSFTGAIGAMFAFVASLFGPEGFTGLAVLLMCETVLVWLLAARRLKAADKAALNLAKAGLAHFDDAFTTIEVDVRKTRLDALTGIEQGIEGLSALASGLTPPKQLPS
jgi:GTP-binding protein EngB required for normal cell division